MSAVEEFIGYFESCEGIQKVMELTDAQFEEAWAIESRVETQTHSEYENVGFEEVSKREKNWIPTVSATTSSGYPAIS